MLSTCNQPLLILEKSRQHNAAVRRDDCEDATDAYLRTTLNIIRVQDLAQSRQSGVGKAFRHSILDSKTLYTCNSLV